jgi:hypothetical protein
VRGTPRSSRYPAGNGACRNVPVAAACCGNPIRGLCSGLRIGEASAALPDRHGEEWAAGSSPAEGSSRMHCKEAISERPAAWASAASWVSWAAYGNDLETSGRPAGPSCWRFGLPSATGRPLVGRPCPAVLPSPSAKPTRFRQGQPARAKRSEPRSGALTGSRGGAGSTNARAAERGLMYGGERDPQPSDHDLSDRPPATDLRPARAPR